MTIVQYEYKRKAWARLDVFQYKLTNFIEQVINSKRAPYLDYLSRLREIVQTIPHSNF